ncbi:hypothetical protein BDN72DRAFT_776911 [Pluteus cervinus]|uniref:Uncharacterized protein n=1 Tax=Pluteus cervinus TaxID=181527 RepID=A0ACD3AA82_9AGAR|nr:hypothetical protein BDN72DRAFT_776911 [Pluteus cervinus]
MFLLRAYLILVFGDIPAISMIMRIKGHNGIIPCRMCKITGLRVPDARATTHYVPLDRSQHPLVQDSPDDTVVVKYNPLSLPLRTHSEFLKQAHDVQFALTTAESERLAKRSGVKGIPILSCLSSLEFPTSFPYDFMHLIFENVLKNLVLLWTGKYKNLNEGSGAYQLPKKVWDAIGAATAALGSSIPGAFGARPPNVAEAGSASTADTWCFWLCYLGPILLSQRFKRRIYFKHFVDLAQLIHICLQFEITATEIQKLRIGFAKWVEKYEQYVIDQLS